MHKVLGTAPPSGPGDEVNREEGAFFVQLLIRRPGCSNPTQTTNYMQTETAWLRERGDSPTLPEGARRFADAARRCADAGAAGARRFADAGLSLEHNELDINKQWLLTSL